MLRAAFNEVRFGIVVLDYELRAQFTNRAFRRMWRLPDTKADSKPVSKAADKSGGKAEGGGSAGPKAPAATTRNIGARSHGKSAASKRVRPAAPAKRKAAKRRSGR